MYTDKAEEEAIDLTIIDEMVFDEGQEETKEQNMYSELSTERCYLADRLISVAAEKRQDAFKHFHIGDMDMPRTGKEIVERIKNGLYVIPEKEDAVHYFDHAWDRVIWRDPAKPADKAGHEAFGTALEKLQTEAMDLIVVADDPNDGLAAVKALQDMKVETIH